MAGGRPRKPKQLKILHGTFRPDRNPANEPDPERPIEIPKAPTHLGPFGKRKWKDLATRLAREGLLTVLDVEALEMLCEAYDQYRSAHHAVHHRLDTATGRTQKRTLQEYLATHSFQTQIELSAMNSQFEFYRKLLIEFGMTPASRNRIEVPKDRGGRGGSDGGVARCGIGGG
ncbi:MAG: phage terminase small subunit P27 family [Candidatus Competibacteraceae bacterium]|nr:phage terminase small subunit P27 family [Candidatus Competibacteraceae bacterium]